MNIDYDFVYQALKAYYEVPHWSNVREIFTQQSFDEQLEDIAEALREFEPDSKED